MSKKTISSPDCILYHNGNSNGYTAGSPSSIEQALADAVSGDTISVFKNESITSNLAKNGVNWHFAPGVTITRSDNSVGYIFSDNGSPVSFTVSGFGNFVRSIGATFVAVSNYDTGLLKISHAGSVVNFDFDTITINQADGASNGGAATIPIAIAGIAGTLNMRGRKLIINNLSTTVSLTGVWWNDGDNNLHVEEFSDLTTAAGGATVFYSAPVASPVGDLRVKCLKMACASIANNVIYQLGSGNTSAAWFDSLTVQGVIQNLGGKLYVTGQKLIGSALIAATGSKTYLKFQKIGGDFSTATIYVQNAGGLAWIDIDDWEPGTNATNLFKSTSANATTYLRGENLTAAAANAALWVSNGTLSVLSGKITSDAGQLDLKRTGGTLIVSDGVVYNPTKTSSTINAPTVYAQANNANTSIVVPAGYAIASILFSNTTANAVTGGIKVGTTSGATDVVAAQAVGANAIVQVADSALLLKVFSTSVAQTLFIQAVTAWNGAIVDCVVRMRNTFAGA